MAPRCHHASMLLILISISSLCHAQKNTEAVASLQETFPNDKVVASTLQSLITFNIHGDELIADEEEEISMIALQPNMAGSREIFYHDQKEILSTKFISGNGRAPARTCGNYEVESIFYSDAKFCSYPYKFAYSGEEITFKSLTRHKDPRYLTKVVFHDELSVKQRTVTFRIPTGTTIELVEKNFEGFDIKRTVREEGDGKTITYSVSDLNALKREENSLGMLYYYPHIIVVTKDFESKNGRKKVIGSAEDLYNWYSGIVRQVNNDKRALEEQVAKLTEGAGTPADKIRKIYYWVQDNIKYIAFEDGISGFRPEAAQNVLINRYGDCKGMANLTKEMLIIAGLDARLAWIGTNRIPYTYELPSLAVDNHMICVAYAGDTEYILDPTEKFIALGRHGERIQGKEMMIENGDKFVIRKVPVATADQNLILRTEEILLEGETIKGKGQISIHGEARKDILYLSTNIRQDNQKKLFDYLAVSGYGNSDEVTVVNIPEVNRDKELDLRYTYSLENKVTAFDNDLYVDIDWNKKFRNMQIDTSRISDYSFHRKIKDRVTKSLKIPAGYKVTHLPSTVKRIHDDFSFHVKYEQKGNTLFYTNEIMVSHGIVKKRDFETWNRYIKDLSASYDDQIIFSKIQ